MITILIWLDLILTYVGGIQNEGNPLAAIALSYGMLSAVGFKLLALGHNHFSVFLLRWLFPWIVRYYKAGILVIYLSATIWNLVFIWRNT